MKKLITRKEIDKNINKMLKIKKWWLTNDVDIICAIITGIFVTLAAYGGAHLIIDIIKWINK